MYQSPWSTKRSGATSLQESDFSKNNMLVKSTFVPFRRLRGDVSIDAVLATHVEFLPRKPGLEKKTPRRYDGILHVGMCVPSADTRGNKRENDPGKIIKQVATTSSTSELQPWECPWCSPPSLPPFYSAEERQNSDRPSISPCVQLFVSCFRLRRLLPLQ